MRQSVPFRPRIGRAALLFTLVVGASLAFAAGASAQTATRSMTLNQLRGYAWPTVTINFNLRSLNNTALGEVRPGSVHRRGERRRPEGDRRRAGARYRRAPLGGARARHQRQHGWSEAIAAQAAAAAFIGALGPQDEVALVPFGTTVLSPTASPPTGPASRPP